MWVLPQHIEQDILISTFVLHDYFVMLCIDSTLDYNMCKTNGTCSILHGSYLKNLKIHFILNIQGSNHNHFHKVAYLLS